MKRLLRIAGLFAIAASAFALSGILANLSFLLFSCIYASSGLFSVSFLGFGAGLGHLFDIGHWFS